MLRRQAEAYKRFDAVNNVVTSEDPFSLLESSTEEELNRMYTSVRNRLCELQERAKRSSWHFVRGSVSVLSAELHAIELSPIVWPMNEVRVGDLGVLEQEDVIDQSAKITVKRNARRILVIATNHEKLSEACQ